jgi:hypothetical protein
MTRRRLLIALSVLAGLTLAAWLGFQLALRELEGAVRGALGPRASLAGLSIDQGGVELRGLRIAAERGGANGWPVDEELQAERVRLVPRWQAVGPALWSTLSGRGHARWQLARVEVHGARVSVLRTRDGRLRVLPAVLERPAATPVGHRRRSGPGAAAVLLGLGAARAAGPAESAVPTAAAPAAAPVLEVLIGEVLLRELTVDFHDASIARPPHRLQLTGLQAELGAIAWPRLDEPVPVRLEAALQGRPGARGEAAGSRDGQLRIDGWLTPKSRDAQLKVSLQAVDLSVLQPYLLGVHSGGIRRGRLDLTLDAQVRAQRLRAPGRVVIRQLELGPSPGALGGFAGLPRQLVLQAMERQGRIELQFTLEGRLDDPAFSLNENLATKVGVGLAEALGVSVGGAVEGLGALVKGLFGR